MSVYLDNFDATVFDPEWWHDITSRWTTADVGFMKWSGNAQFTDLGYVDRLRFKKLVRGTVEIVWDSESMPSVGNYWMTYVRVRVIEKDQYSGGGNNLDLGRDAYVARWRYNNDEINTGGSLDANWDRTVGESLDNTGAWKIVLDTVTGNAEWYVDLHAGAGWQLKGSVIGLFPSGQDLEILFITEQMEYFNQDN